MKREEFSELPKLVQQYLLYLEAIKGHSELSVIEYASDLRTFFRYILREKGFVDKNTEDAEIDLSPVNLDLIKKITLNDAYQFLIYCKSVRHNNENTRARRVIAIRRFFIYLTDNMGLLEYNPMKNLDIPKTKKLFPNILLLKKRKSFYLLLTDRIKKEIMQLLLFFLTAECVWQSLFQLIIMT